MSLHYFAFHLLPTVYCLLPAAYCLLPTAYCLLLTAYRLLPTARCLLPTAYCLHPTAAHRGHGAVYQKLRVDLKRESRSRHYASIMRMGFPKSRQFVELFEAPKGISYDGRGRQRSSGRLVYPAETLYN